MSCIPKILELKGDKEFLPVPGREDTYHGMGVVVECGGNYKGYDWLVIFQDMGFRCGYVALPSDHPIHQSEQKYPDNFDVHGGVTFFDENHLSSRFFAEKACTDKWIGFDAGHAWDLSDVEATKKYFPNLRPTQLGYVVERSSNRWGDGSRCELRTKEYMEKECRELIDQLIEMRNAA